VEDVYAFFMLVVQEAYEVADAVVFAHVELLVADVDETAVMPEHFGIL
jgi:hypothetical protein